MVLLPEGQDPDDFARKHTLEQVQDHIARNEQDFITFKTDLLLGEAGNDPLKRADLINDIADTISLIPDAVTRAVYVRSCSVRFEIDEQILADRVGRSRTQMLIADKEQKEREKQETAAELMKEACKKYENVYFIQTNATDELHETSVDGTHPGDYGYTLWANSIEKPLLKILKKYGIRKK